MLARDVPGIVEEYETKKRSANAIDAVDSFYNLVSRGAREVAIDSISRATPSPLRGSGAVGCLDGLERLR